MRTAQIHRRDAPRAFWRGCPDSFGAFKEQVIMPGELTRAALTAEANADSVKAASQLTIGKLRVLRGLLWAEWFAHSQLLLSFLVLWLLCVWVMPVLAHPGFILLLGGVYALLAGSIYGGQDVVHGCEEFSFSLPATRSERYLARLAVGGGTLLFFTVLD